MMFKQKVLLGALLLTSSAAFAAPATPAPVTQKVYAGVGISHNRVDFEAFGSDVETAGGMQIFAGVKTGSRNGFDLAVEAGYMDTADFSHTDEDLSGVWFSGVAKRTLSEVDGRLAGIARVGVDLGDDDGIFMGFGAEFKLAPAVFVRAEYLAKDISQSYQLNAGFEF